VIEKQINYPNLLVIGVPKAGTTSLYKYLQQSNKVFFPELKEPHFFANRMVNKRIPKCIDRWDDYIALFSQANCAEVIGEASVFYFYYDYHVIAEIKKYLGSDIRIILLLRNPVERAFSAYKYALALNKDENQCFSNALDLENRRIDEKKVSPTLFYKACGMYSRRLENWMDNFPNMKVIIF